MEKKSQILWGIVVIVVLAIGAYLYVSRPLAAPSTDSAAPNNTASVTAQAGETVFTIDGTQSEAKYEIDETLNGNPKHVVGVTKDISGQIIVNVENPSESKIGKISINARTLKTDNDRRDNTVGRMILKSEDTANEFIVFETTKLLGMPSEIKEGEEFLFKATGNLTVAGVTKEATFDGKAKMSGKVLTGSAQSVVKYADYGMTVPSLSFLAWVDDKVTLSLAFTASAQ